MTLVWGTKVTIKFLVKAFIHNGKFDIVMIKESTVWGGDDKRKEEEDVDCRIAVKLMDGTGCMISVKCSMLHIIGKIAKNKDKAKLKEKGMQEINGNNQSSSIMSYSSLIMTHGNLF